MAFKMESPFKKVEELKEVVEQLKGAVKAHGNQAKMVQKHIDMMESPAKQVDNERKEHNKHARKTEGTRFAQFLRRKFGKNRPKKINNYGV